VKLLPFLREAGTYVLKRDGRLEEGSASMMVIVDHHSRGYLWLPALSFRRKRTCFEKSTSFGFLRRPSESFTSGGL